jgi:hypothetical protein
MRDSTNIFRSSEFRFWVLILIILILALSCTKVELKLIVPNQVNLEVIKGTYEITHKETIPVVCDDSFTTPSPEIITIENFFIVEDGCTGEQTFLGSYVYDKGLLKVYFQDAELFTLEVIPLDKDYKEIKMYRCHPYSQGCSVILAKRI